VKYYRYIFQEHARPDYAGSVTAYYEISPDNSFSRSLEVYDDGVAYSYDDSHESDEYGILPDAEMDEESAHDFGELTSLTLNQFNGIWTATAVNNR